MYVQAQISVKGHDLDVQARLEIFLVKREDGINTLSGSTEFYFTPTANHWGFHQFVPLSRLRNVGQGFVDEEKDCVLIKEDVTF